MGFNYLDIIAILLIIFGAIATAKIGFFKTLLSLAAYVGAAIAAKIAAVPVAQYVYTAYVKEGILEKLGSLLPNGSVGEEIGTVIENIRTSLPEALVTLADRFSLFPQINPETQQMLTVAQLEEQYVMPTSVRVISFISAIVVFILALVLLGLVINILNKFFFGKRKHGIIKQLNSVLGFLLGIIKTAIPVCIILAIVVFVAPITKNDYFISVVDGSYFCGLITQLI